MRSIFRAAAALTLGTLTLGTLTSCAELQSPQQQPISPITQFPAAPECSPGTYNYGPTTTRLGAHIYCETPEAYAARMRNIESMYQRRNRIYEDTAVLRRPLTPAQRAALAAAAIEDRIAEQQRPGPWPERSGNVVVGPNSRFSDGVSTSGSRASVNIGGISRLSR